MLGGESAGVGFVVHRDVGAGIFPDLVDESGRKIRREPSLAGYGQGRAGDIDPLHGETGNLFSRCLAVFRDRDAESEGDEAHALPFPHENFRLHDAGRTGWCLENGGEADDLRVGHGAADVDPEGHGFFGLVAVGGDAEFLNTAGGRAFEFEATGIDVGVEGNDGFAFVENQVLAGGLAGLDGFGADGGGMVLREAGENLVHGFPGDIDVGERALGGEREGGGDFLVAVDPAIRWEIVLEIGSVAEQIGDGVGVFAAGEAAESGAALGFLAGEETAGERAAYPFRDLFSLGGGGLVFVLRRHFS